MLPGPPGRHQDTGAEMQSRVLSSQSAKLRSADMDAPSSTSFPPVTQERLPRPQGDCLLETGTLCEVPSHCPASPCELVRRPAKAHDPRQAGRSRVHGFSNCQPAFVMAVPCPGPPIPATGSSQLHEAMTTPLAPRCSVCPKWLQNSSRFSST